MDVKSMKCILLRLYYANNCSAIITRRKYRQETGKRCKVSECSIRRMVRLFEDTGSVVGRRKGSGRKQLIYETKLEVLKMKKKLQSVHPYNCTSVRKIANRPSVSVSHTTVHRILQSESFYPYKPVQVPKLFASDLEMRLKFVKQWEALGINLSDVLWTDEAKFDLHCNVRSLHASISSDKKPIQHI